MTIRKVFSLVLLLAGLAGTCFGQTALTQTTLSGAQSSTATTVTLAACTGITAPILPGTPTSNIFIDGEVEGILTWNTTTCSGVVFRGYMSTRVSAHVSGNNVLIAVPYQTTLGQGANPINNGFHDRDPELNGGCTAAATSTTPYVNILTGAQWLCSTVTLTWVPGFNNPLVANMAGVTAAVASVAGSTLPSGPLFHVTGTNAITGWTQPLGCNATASGACSFTVIPDGVFTWTSAGNIALAGTAVVNKALTFTWDAKNSKWIPSYIA